MASTRKTIAVRPSDAELAELTAAASADGCRVSSYLLRQALAAARGRSVEYPPKPDSLPAGPNAEERERWKAAAERQKMTLSAFVRSAVEAAIELPRPPRPREVERPSGKRLPACTDPSGAHWRARKDGVAQWCPLCRARVAA